jgi:ribonuclease G
MEFLIKLWNEVVKRSESSRCPSLIYNDLDLLLRTVRDLFTADVEKLIIDSRPEYDRVKKFIAAFMPDFAGNIELYLGADPIFDGYGIEIEIDRALERKVWLKSGGYLIVDEMEALTAIDVNTGRFVGKSSLEDTITKTNLEACREVAEQLRIRSIGGMIVVDFIDMDRPHNREKVTRAFNDYLRKDRSKAAVTRISELGLIEMTRKRTRESLLHSLTEPCSSCEGKGYTKSRSTVAYELLRELRRQGDMIESDTIIIEVHPDVAQVLATTDHGFLEDLEKRLQKRLVVKSRGSFHMEDFEIHSPGEKAIEKSEMAGGGRDKDEPKRRHRRKRALGSPADVEALLNEEESSAVSPEFMPADDEAEAQAQVEVEAQAQAQAIEELAAADVGVANLEAARGATNDVAGAGVGDGPVRSLGAEDDGTAGVNGSGHDAPDRVPNPESTPPTLVESDKA